MNLLLLVFQLFRINRLGLHLIHHELGPSNKLTCLRDYDIAKVGDNAEYENTDKGPACDDSSLRKIK